MAVRAIYLGFLALVAGACGFDPAGGRASRDDSDAAAGTDSDGSPAGTPDASPPGTPDGGPDGFDASEPLLETKIDELTVPSTGEVVESDVTLESGVTYRLVVSGVVQVSTSGGGFSADAEYFWRDSDPNAVFDGQTGDPPIDIGVAIDDTVVNGTKTPDWGGPRLDHTYEDSWPGEDKTIEAQFHERNTDNNTGDFTLEIWEPTL